MTMTSEMQKDNSDAYI